MVIEVQKSKNNQLCRGNKVNIFELFSSVRPKDTYVDDDLAKRLSVSKFLGPYLWAHKARLRVRMRYAWLANKSL